LTDEPFGLHAIGQVLVPVEDVDRATAFYRDVLGMRFLYAFPGMAFFDCDGTRIYLARPNPDYRGRATIYFTVPDADAAFATLVDRGAEAESAPEVIHRAETYELRMGFVRDPDGNHVGVMTEVPVGASGG
jgi:methylmalonyl-CoA/ethylmalonyl-CoA epimerase